MTIQELKAKADEITFLCEKVRERYAAWKTADQSGQIDAADALRRAMQSKHARLVVKKQQYAALCVAYVEAQFAVLPPEAPRAD